MKKTKRLWALLLAMVMALGLISTAFAAPTIDSGRKASLSLYKYDITAASEDGAWNTASYVSTGVQDDAVTDKLAQYAILVTRWRALSWVKMFVTWMKHRPIRQTALPL